MELNNSLAFFLVGCSCSSSYCVVSCRVVSCRESRVGSLQSISELVLSGKKPDRAAFAILHMEKARLVFLAPFENTCATYSALFFPTGYDRQGRPSIIRHLRRFLGSEHPHKAGEIPALEPDCRPRRQRLQISYRHLFSRLCTVVVDKRAAGLSTFTYP